MSGPWEDASGSTRDAATGQSPDLSIDLAPGRAGGLRLRYPILVASGGAGHGNELLDAVGDDPPGAIVTRGISLVARTGDPPPRMAALPDALLSSVGVHDPGIEVILRRQAPRWAAYDVPVIVSIRADTASDIRDLASRLDMHPGVAGIELDLAAPDRSRNGLPIGSDVKASEVATVSARSATELPLLVKLTASATDVREIARAVAAAGADSISAIERQAGLAIDPLRDRAMLGTAYGGLSGPALKSVALRVVYEIAQVVRIPVIGIGGISSLDDVLDMLAAGATCVGLATAALADPALPGRLGKELQRWCSENGRTSISELVGTALPRRRDRGSLRPRWPSARSRRG